MNTNFEEVMSSLNQSKPKCSKCGIAAFSSRWKNYQCEADRTFITTNSSIDMPGILDKIAANKWLLLEKKILFVLILELERS